MDVSFGLLESKGLSTALALVSLKSSRRQNKNHTLSNNILHQVTTLLATNNNSHSHGHLSHENVVGFVHIARCTARRNPISACVHSHHLHENEYGVDEPHLHSRMCV